MASGGRSPGSLQRRNGQERRKNEEHKTSFIVRLTITLITRLLSAFLGGGLVVSKLGRRAVRATIFLTIDSGRTIKVRED